MGKNSETYSWYATLRKPAWALPAWVFGPVWSVLYFVIAISFGTVFYSVAQDQLPFFVAVPFVINLVCNIAFMPLQFWLRSNILAALDILVLLGTLIWLILVIYPLMWWVAMVNIPYLVWVSFATVLQLTITYLNFKK